MRRSRRLAHLALFALLAAGWQGCNDSGKVTELRFHTLAKPGSHEYKLLEAILAEFNGRHSEVQVALVGARPTLEHLTRHIIARRAADVVELDAGEVGILARRGAVKQLTAADLISIGRECEPSAWHLGHWGDELYAVPWAARPKLLLYNRAAFREGGLPDDKPPQTWREFVDTAKKLTRDTDGDGKADVYGLALAGKLSPDLGKHFGTFVAQLGEGLLLFHERQMRWIFNPDRGQGQRVMSLLLELQEFSPPECVVSDDARALGQFRAGRAAMVISGPSGLCLGPDAPRQFEIGVGRVPRPADGRDRCCVEFRLASIPAFVEGARRDAAVKLLKFLAGRTAQEMVAKGVDGCTSALSIRRELLAGDRYARRPRLRAFAESVRDAIPVVPSLIWEGKCSKDWIGAIHSILIPLDDERGVAKAVGVAYEKGDRALSCLYTDIGHPSATVTLGMSLVGLLVFVVVAYVISRH